MSALDVLLLRFDAPMVSFGGARVDTNGVQQVIPGRAMLTGLLGNALGWEHREADRLGALQARLRYAVRQDHAGDAMIDYHTVDMGQPFMLEGWTTRGAPESRAGGESRTGTLIRLQHYRVDAEYSIALTVVGDGTPTVDELARALERPERPLFIGRKCCLPASPILRGRVRAASLRAALAPFRGTIEQIPPDHSAVTKGNSWKEGCGNPSWSAGPRDCQLGDSSMRRSAPWTFFRPSPPQPGPRVHPSPPQRPSWAPRP